MNNLPSADYNAELNVCVCVCVCSVLQAESGVGLGVCGSDGISYSSECEVKEQACLLQRDLVLLDWGKCQGECGVREVSGGWRVGGGVYVARLGAAGLREAPE